MEPLVFDALARLSDHRRGDTANERQIENIHEWAGSYVVHAPRQLSLHGRPIRIRHIHIEEETGFDPRGKREGLQRIREALETKEVDGAVFFKVARLGRLGMVQVGTMLDLGLIAFVGDNLYSWVKGDRRRIADASESAREESEEIGSRVADAKRHNRKNGKWLGGRPPAWYWNDDGFLRLVDGGRERYRYLIEAILQGETFKSCAQQLNAEGIPTSRSGLWEARNVKRAIQNPDPEVWGEDALAYLRTSADVHGAQYVPHRMIAREMNEAGIAAPSGEWSASTLSLVLRNPVLCGWLPEGRPSKDGSYRWSSRGDYARDEAGNPMVVAEAVMTPAERQTLIEELNRRKVSGTNGTGHGKKSTSFLTGSIFCGVPRCGSGMTLAGRSYKCSAANLGAKTIPNTAYRPALETFVIGRVAAFLATLREGDPLLEAAIDRWARVQSPNIASEYQLACEAVANAEANLADVMVARHGDATTPARYTTPEMISVYDARLLPAAVERLDAAKSKRDTIERPQADITFFRDPVGLRRLLEDSETPLTRKREVVNLVTRRIVILPGRGKGYRFDGPARVVIYGHDGEPV